jgi:RHS repeat-associated protein
MPVTNYYTVNGEIIGEQTTGQERIDYLTDPLGNVTATIDQNAKVLNRYTYKPFGELLSKEGTAPDPKFLWVGAHGYRQTGKKYADVYIRKRTYDTSGGRWMSKDPIGYKGGINRYQYTGGKPTMNIDPSGTLALVKQPFKFGNCGHAEWIVGFKLSSEETEGYIVQKITVSLETQRCMTHPWVCFCLFPAPEDSFTCTYYEAWRVSGGQIVGGISTDTWFYPGKGKCTQGWHEWAAKVKFIPNFQLQSPPWTTGCCAGYSGELPCHPGDSTPQGWTEEDTIERYMRIYWDCCPIEKPTYGGAR